MRGLVRNDLFPAGKGHTEVSRSIPHRRQSAPRADRNQPPEDQSPPGTDREDRIFVVPRCHSIQPRSVSNRHERQSEYPEPSGLAQQPIPASRPSQTRQPSHIRGLPHAVRIRISVSESMTSPTGISPPANAPQHTSAGHDINQMHCGSDSRGLLWLRGHPQFKRRAPRFKVWAGAREPVFRPKNPNGPNNVRIRIAVLCNFEAAARQSPGGLSDQNLPSWCDFARSTAQVPRQASENVEPLSLSSAKR